MPWQLLPGHVGFRSYEERKTIMSKVKMGLLVFWAILTLQAPLSASADNIPEGTGLPDGAVENTEDTEGEGFPEGIAVPGDSLLPGNMEPGDTVSSGDLLPGDIVTPGDLFPEDAMLQEDAAGDDPGKEGEPTGIPVIVWVICVLAAAVAVCIAVWAVQRKKNRKPSRNPGDLGKTESGIPIQLEVYAGNCRNTTPYLTLSDCLDIGSKADCDIIFDDPGVAPLHCRIRFTGSQVYMEDLGSPVGTALDGMRIQGQNRLRGGEVISLGAVEFCIVFLQDV